MEIYVYLMFSMLKQKHGLTTVPQSVQKKPKGCPEEPQGSPKRSQDTPKAAQKGSKSIPRRSPGGYRGPRVEN